jgi:RHS repeat-associated protein
MSRAYDAARAALNRLTAKTYPDSTSAEYTYDLVGKISQVNDPTGTYAFAYDNMGRLIGTTTTYSFLTTPFTNSYSYDADSNRTGFTAPDSSTNTYTYDTLNRLTTLANSWAGSFGFSYDAISRRTQMTRPNGIATNYAYDKLSHLLSVLHQAGASTIDGEAYTLDAAGNRTAKTDYLAGVTSNYTYDKIYELLTAMQGTNTTESYSYDTVGNRLSSLGVSSYTNNTSNELTSTSAASYTYDNNGNTLTKTDSTGTTNYSWDFENRLTQVALPGTGGTVSFKYDPFGRRIEKTTSSTTSIYAYDGDNVIETTNAAGAIISKYAQGQNIDEPLAESTAGATSFYEQDGLGSVTSLSSSAGALANTYTYDSFGKLTNSSGTLTNPFQYTGRELDSETGLYYYRARYYDSSSGRFLSEDRLRFQGGANFYRYVQNSPLVWIDPSGDDHYCYTVTPNGMTEKPCVDPNHGEDCVYVPGGVSCRVPIPPGPPAAPPTDYSLPSDFDCPCDPLNLEIQANKILIQQEQNDLRILGWVPVQTGVLQGLEHGFEHLGLGGAADVIPVLDLSLLGHDAYDSWRNLREARDKLTKLFKPCEH